MNDLTVLSLLGLFSYLLGAIPFSLILCRLNSIDLRTVGSGNLGATNMFRALGFKWAFAVFLLDGSKGFIPTFICQQLFANQPSYHILIGCIAIIGHSLSIYVRFKGGKGVATGAGVLLALNVYVFALISVVAIAIIWRTKYVSLASISCSILTPLFLYLWGAPIAYIGFVSSICIFIIWRHRGNVVRLIKGNERKI